jgi:hypothetical protein
MGHDGFDLINGGRMARRGELCAPHPVQALKLEVAIIQRRREMRSGPTRFATADRPIIYDDHGLACTGEEIGGC